MILPEVVQGIDSGPVAFRQLVLQPPQFVEHTIMPHSADTRHAPEADGKKVQPSGNQVPFLQVAEQPGINHFQALHLPQGLVIIQMGSVDLRIALHHVQLPGWGLFTRKLSGNLHVLGTVDVDVFHVHPSLSPVEYLSHSSLSIIFIHLYSYFADGYYNYYSELFIEEESPARNRCGRVPLPVRGLVLVRYRNRNPSPWEMFSIS